jgi:hypothetical protein
MALALILPLASYLFLASRFVGAGVGYEMDEALYVQSAVFLLQGGATPPYATGPADGFHFRGRRWPLMVFPYVGAVKAYAALPLFKVFGVRTGVARSAGVALGTVGIAGLALLLAARAGPAAGLAAGLLLAVHPSYLDYTVFDNGGVSVWMAGMGLMALALAAYLRRPSPITAFLFGAAAGLGVWGRANVLWLVAAAAAGALAGFGRRAIPPPRHLAAAAAGGFLGALPLVLYELRSGFWTLRLMSVMSQPLTSSRLAARLRDLAELLISDAEQRAIWWGPPLPGWQMALGAALFASGLLCGFWRLRPPDSEISRWRRAFSATAAVLSAILLASRLGVSQHHLVAVLPLVVGALVLLSLEIGRAASKAVPLLGLAAAGLLALSLSWDVRIDQGLRRTGGKYVWTSAIEDVAAHLKTHPVPPSRLKILQWGFQNNLYVASGGAVHGVELFWGATKERSGRRVTWSEEIRDGGSFLFYLYPTSPAPEAAEGFSAALAEHRSPHGERLFRDRTGAPVIVLVEMRLAETARAPNR